MHSNDSKPLSGIRVLDLTQVVAGPYAAMLLADAGAEVIKIERPKTGEINRGVGPFVTNDKGQTFSSTLLRYARNRRCMTLDLASASGKDVFKRLVKVSDIVIENFAPTTMTELGLGYDVLKEVNPRIIYGSISGFGHLDILPVPFYKRPAFNSIAQAMGGLADATGELGGPPIEAQAPIGDVFPGTLCTVGILQALYQRERTGLGQHVDVAMYDAMVSMLTMRLQDYIVTGALLERGAKRSSAPNGFFKVKDGYVAIATVGEPMWERFCRAVGKPELVGSPGLERGTDRARNLDTILRPIIEGWAADKTKKEVTDILLAYNVPCGPVQTAQEIMECPHLEARKMLVEADHPVVGKTKYVGSPIKLSAYRDPQYTPPPVLGEHTDDILTGILGMSADEVQKLRDDGVL